MRARKLAVVPGVVALSPSPPLAVALSPPAPLAVAAALPVLLERAAAVAARLCLGGGGGEGHEADGGKDEELLEPHVNVSLACQVSSLFLTVSLSHILYIYTVLERTQ